MDHKIAAEKQASPWSLILLPALLLSVSCGQRNNQDLEEIKPPPPENQENSNAVSSGGFVVQGGAAVQPGALPDKCTIDLKQDVIINPKGSVIRAMFSGKVASLPECEKDGRTAVLYISSPTEFSIDPGYSCKVMAGEFNVRCSGSLVKFTDAGNFQLSISGDGQFESTKIRMRVTFEKPAASDAK